MCYANMFFQCQFRKLLWFTAGFPSGAGMRQSSGAAWDLRLPANQMEIAGRPLRPEGTVD